jgi:hypothetical protein
MYAMILARFSNTCRTFCGVDTQTSRCVSWHRYHITHVAIAQQIEIAMSVSRLYVDNGTLGQLNAVRTMSRHLSTTHSLDANTATTTLASSVKLITVRMLRVTYTAALTRSFIIPRHDANELGVNQYEISHDKHARACYVHGCPDTPTKSPRFISAMSA